MSKICITEAPPCPPKVLESDWDAEWAGLEVYEAREFGMHIGYLGERYRIFDTGRKLYRPPTPTENMNIMTVELKKDNYWIANQTLLHACKQAQPPRQLIISWLEAPSQVGRLYFAVPKSSADQLP